MSGKLARISRCANQIYKAAANQTFENRISSALYHLVVLPDKPQYYIENFEDPVERREIHRWWAENLIRFHSEIQVIYIKVTRNNLEWEGICERTVHDRELGYPNGVTYKWKTSRETPPQVLPVDQYIVNVLAWCSKEIRNETIFPLDDDREYPSNFEQISAKMFGRLFRLLNIMISNRCLFQNDLDNNLILCLRHFLYFGWKWKLLKLSETETMKVIVPVVKDQFLNDQEAYNNKELSKD